MDTSTDIKVFESGAILTYLAETYDTASTLLPPASKPADRYSVLQWLTWQVAGLGPMFGQMFHFLRYAKEDVPYGKKRYTEEANRLLVVLDKQLEASGSGYVCSSGLSIADFAIAPWVAFPYKKMGGKGPLDWSKVPNVVKYCELIETDAAYAAATAEPEV
jgi:GST-like protein